MDMSPPSAARPTTRAVTSPPADERGGGHGAALALRDVSRVFAVGRRPVAALADVTLDVAPGELLAVIGPSGAGKSTLLRLLADLDEPTAGSIAIDGASPADARARGWTGMVFQDATLLPWRTALDNVLLPAQIGYGRRGARGGGEGVSGLGGEARAQAAALLDRVGLAGFHGARVWQLSGGMRQRVSLARALMLRPRVLLLDEPFGALDEITRERMNAELVRVLEGSGATAVLITHSLTEAILLADRIAILTARPGRLYHVESVALPRPRSSALIFTPAFVELSLALRRLLADAEVRGEPGDDRARGAADDEEDRP